MLAIAARRGDLEKVAELVKTANVNGRHYHYQHAGEPPLEWTPLWGAALNGHLPVVKLLVEHGAVVQLRVSGTTPLFIAAAGNNTAVVAFLKSRGGCIRTGGSMARSPLWVAAYRGNTAVVAWLIARGVDVNAQDAHRSRSPLWCAANNGHHDVAAALLAAGADVNLPSHTQHTTPLAAAAVKDDVVMMRLLASRAKDKINIDGGRTMTCAALAGACHAVGWLAVMGADLGPCCHDATCLLGWRRHFVLEDKVRRVHHPAQLRVASFLHKVAVHNPTCLEIAIAIGEVAIVTAQLNDGVDVHTLLPSFGLLATRIHGARLDPNPTPMATLLKAASLPWAPNRHRLFGKLPRQQIEALLRCGTRLPLPSEVVHIICSFVTRKHGREDVDTAWPDRLGALAMCTVIGVMIGLAAMP